MKNEEPISRRPQGCDYSDTVGQQAAAHAEAHRRLDNIAGAAVDTATGRTMDSWSSGGLLPGGTVTPDVVKPETVGFGVTETPTLAPQERPQNFEDIMRNPHGERR